MKVKFEIDIETEMAASVLKNIYESREPFTIGGLFPKQKFLALRMFINRKPLYFQGAEPVGYEYGDAEIVLQQVD